MKKLSKEIIVSGIQTSGKLHLGNYLGAIKNWVSLQNKYADQGAQIYLFLADHHAITDKFKMGSNQDFELTLQEDTIEMIATLLAAGLDPKKSTIFLQSQVPQHAELTWLFSCIGPMHWMNTMIQFKEKKSKQSSLGLFSYPVLMAADILLYNAHKVPVGEDQRQHLELTKNFANRYNTLFGDYFNIPECINSNHPRVMSLKDGRKKMSKSDPSDNSRINLNDDPEVIYSKIRKATTDSISQIKASESRPEITNLMRIYSSITDLNLQEVEQRFQGQNTKQFKDSLSEELINTICPMGLRIETLLEDRDNLRNILMDGSNKARTVAEQNIKEIKYKMGYVV